MLKNTFLSGVLTLLLAAPVLAHPAWRFADDFTQVEVVHQPDRLKTFVELYADHEAPFFARARDKACGLTYDGVNLDPRTGQVRSLRPLTAPSKECLDLALLVKGLEGHPLAARVIAPDDPGDAPRRAKEMLRQKIDTYWAYHRQRPGYAGFLPWFYTGAVFRPGESWGNDFPGLDNGEMIFSMLAAERELRLRGFDEAAKSYADYLKLMSRHCVNIFYDPKAKLLRGETHCRDIKDINSPYAPRGTSFLTGEHGVHEGVMITLFVTLFGEGLPKEGAEHIWQSTRMVRVETPYGTTWQGFWGSAHEEWAYLFLPYLDMPEYKQLFRIREAIRSNNAVARGYPGFATSCLEPGDEKYGAYHGACGIEGVGSQELQGNDLYALYGSFPALLLYADQAGPNLGMAWLLNMLQGPKMQGPMGAGESGSNDGSKACYSKTCDGSYPILLAMMGGLGHEVAEAMKERGVYDRFIEIMRAEYQESFGDKPLAEPVPFALPQARIPRDRLKDYQ